MKQTLLSTVEVAKATGVPRSVLQHWIKTGKIAAPRMRIVGNKAARFWTPAQVNQIRRMKGRLKPGPKPGSRRAKKRG